MNEKPSVYRSDSRSLEFILAVVVGGVGSTILSGLRISPFVSVGFALSVMMVLAFLRWRVASEFKDHESLEAFAEDIYLLGYLLTLAALLGMAPRLMSDESNLFTIAGMKLITTVVGLGLMMIFRQIARRWAQEEELGVTSHFAAQQRQFSEAISHLNRGAEELTAKLSEVVHRFDPELLIPVAEWSNRASGAFSQVTQVLERVLPAIQKNADGLKTLEANLEQVRTASTDLAGTLTANTAHAAKALAGEMTNAGRAVHALSGSVGCLQPASDAARVALEGLGNQASLGVNQFNAIHASLNQSAVELGKVGAALKKISDENATNVDAPLSKLVKALETSASKTVESTASVDAFREKLLTTASQHEQAGARIEASVVKSLSENKETMARVHQLMSQAGADLQNFAKQLENVAVANRVEKPVEFPEMFKNLQAEMRETNTQLKNLVAAIHSSTGNESKPGFLSWLKGNRE